MALASAGAAVLMGKVCERWRNVAVLDWPAWALLSAWSGEKGLKNGEWGRMGDSEKEDEWVCCWLLWLGTSVKALEMDANGLCVCEEREMGEASMSSGGDSDLTRLCSLRIPSSSAMLSRDGEWSRLFC